MDVKYLWVMNSADLTGVMVPADDRLTCPWLNRVQLSAATAKRPAQRASDEMAAPTPFTIVPTNEAPAWVC